jgi:hypothetical protein
VGYSRIAADVGQAVNAIPHMLRAVSLGEKGDEKDWAEAKELLVKAVQSGGGAKVLLAQMHDAAQTWQAVSFMAGTFKDNGGVPVAAQLYKHCLTLHQQDKLPVRDGVNHILHLVHTLEVQNKYVPAWKYVLYYLKKNSTQVLKNNNNGSAVSLASLYVLLKDVKDPYNSSLRTGECKAVTAYQPVVTLADAGETQVQGVKKQNVDHGLSPIVADTGYTEQELLTLAVCFTAVKLLFLCGGLQVLPALINVLEPLRKGHKLHLTLIRNEHAYYSTIAQMVPAVPFPLSTTTTTTTSPEKKVYVLGDSHCLSSAWQTYAGLRFIPKLATGVKCWHLRPESKFYPKQDFQNQLASVPLGSMVVFCVGEIDCREGLLAAVHKGVYATLKEAIQTVVGLYVDTLVAATRTRQLTSYVHPIPPVLNETRQVVLAFSTALQAEIATRKQARLVYLDFDADLVDVNIGALKQEYACDGTHLHPRYTAVLARTINQYMG